jgi:hypothetical protein
MAFDRWRQVYNLERPHDALGGKPPASRYAPSPRAFPERLPEITYPAGACVRKVQHCGRISYQGRELRVPSALHGYPIALQPRPDEDGVLDVFFCRQGRRDRLEGTRLLKSQCVTHVPA